MAEETGLDLFYKHQVDSCFKTKSNFIISNGAPSHAAALFATMFRYAIRNVQIFSKCLKNEVFDDIELCENFKNAIDRGVKVEIIIQDSSPDESKFLDTIKGIDKSDILYKSLKHNDLSCNFAIMDDSAYRYEPSRNEICAEACANDEENVKILQRNFEIIKRNIVPICTL